MTEGIGGFLEKGKELAAEHPDQAQHGLDEAEQFANDKTGGAHGDQIAKGEKLLGDKLGLGEGAEQQPPQ
jgi:hypothetical protein